MCGFILGMLTILFFAKMTMRRRYHGHHGWHGGPRRRSRRRRGRRDVSRAMGELFKRRLDIDEDQEDIVDLALKDARKTLDELRAVLGDSRKEIADAFRGDEVDDATLTATLSHADEEVTRLRRELIFSLKQIHAVLDEDQRNDAADWLGGRRA
jgi:uncharacterized membrane protein